MYFLSGLIVTALVWECLFSLHFLSEDHQNERQMMAKLWS